MASKTGTPAARDLGGYEVVVCVCGGIAAYKTCEVVSTLVQRGAGVTVAMTRAATSFIGPVTFAALTARRVLTDLWHPEQATDVRHISLTGTADLLLVAPATANIIGKMAGGLADDLVTTLVLSADSPILLAPAMNDRMWNNPVVQRNLADLKERGFASIGPREGWLACRGVGPGRMADSGELVDSVAARLCEKPPRGKEV